MTTGLENMEVEKFREALRRFAGNPQYRKFVRTMTTKVKGTGKLLYWQEKLWKRFSEEYPEFADYVPQQLEEALNLCHLHLLDLKQENVKAYYVRQTYPTDYIKSRDLRFPYGNMVFFGDSNAKPKTPHRNVAFCEECRKELIRWNARRKDKFGLE